MLRWTPSADSFENEVLLTQKGQPCSKNISGLSGRWDWLLLGSLFFSFIKSQAEDALGESVNYALRFNGTDFWT